MAQASSKRSLLTLFSQHPLLGFWGLVVGMQAWWFRLYSSFWRKKTETYVIL
jgi:hypothetical protein